MHLFLTAPQFTGKTTVLRRTLALLGVAPGGFYTYFGPDRANPQRYLYLAAAQEPPAYDAAHRIARFTSCDAPPEVDLARFNEDAAGLLRKARLESRLILMDELGLLERKAEQFQREVFSCLDGDIPVIGVVRLREGGWTSAIAAHPGVALVEVTTENRAELPQQLAGRLKPYLEERT